ncbi:translation initiation factor IF-2 [Clostridiaceae bacterium Marseille-Q4145]|nr:translation initiation factor IF-2 [Clostridiaceae bacterium Marseille-Q4145]
MANKIRVYELAKELNKTSKEVMSLLAEKNIEVTTHMATLEDNQADMIRAQAGQAKQETPKTGDTPKASEDAKPKKKKFIVVHNPENSRDRKSPERRPAQPKTQAAKPVQKPVQKPAAAPKAEAKSAAKPEVKAEAKPAAAPKAAETRTENRTEGRPAGRPQGDRQGYNRGDRPQGDRQGYNRGDRPQGDRQGYNRGDRPQGDRQGYNRGDRPQGDRQGYNRGDRPQGDRQGYNRGDRPQGDRQGYNRGDRPQGDRQGYNRGDRPQGGGYNRGGDRPQGGGYNRGGDRPQGNGFNRGGQGGGRDGRGGQNGRGGIGRQMNKAFDTPVETKPENRRYDNRNHQKQEKQYKDEDISKLKNRPGRFIKPAPQPVEQKKESTEPKKLPLPEMISISDLAERMKIQPSAIIKKLFLEGKMLTVNSELDFEAAGEIALEYNFDPEPEVKEDVIGKLLEDVEDPEDTLVQRPPVVCVMGHVDHGKTSLLDAIRHTNVTDREAGGITQHIGAYTVTIKDRKITFLDTPGHEAFTAMRMRGASSTDIAILVVAADDGVKPQTVEAINHAKAAGVEVIVAINKIDKPGANVDRVKQELTEYGLISEDWGGSTICVPVSAKSREGIEDLLEMVLLTADVLELKSNPKRQARGLVIEAELDKGKGPVATVLVQKGTLHVGDFIAAGASYGKVRAMMDDKGRRVKEAGPSTPVEILGLNDVPMAGEIFVSPESDKEARTFAETFIKESREKMLEDTKLKMSLDDLYSQIQTGNLKELNLIIKADVAGSVEAVKQSLLKLSNEEVVVKCIHGAVGAINESDVILASASSAIIIGFNTRIDPAAKDTAEREKVDVRLYRVIYDAIADVERAMKGMLDPIFEEKVIGHAEIRQIFKASGVGNIAGSYVLDGMFQRGCKVRITREGKQIYEGELASLKRFKDDVKEVKAGFECGLVFDKFNDIQELDVVEAYTMVEVPR